MAFNFRCAILLLCFITFGGTDPASAQPFITPLVEIDENPNTTDPSAPPYEIEETEDDIIISFCFEKPREPGKEICIEIKIDKETKRATVTIEGILLLPVQLFLKCDEHGCRLETARKVAICWTTNTRGRVTVDCLEEYRGIHLGYRTTDIWIDQDNLCATDGYTTRCVPIEDLPDDLKDLWKRGLFPFLPPYPCLADPDENQTASGDSFACILPVHGNQTDLIQK